MLDSHEQLAAYVDEICRRGEKPTILFGSRSFEVKSAVTTFDRPGLLFCTLADNSELVIPVTCLVGVISASPGIE